MTTGIRALGIVLSSLASAWSLDITGKVIDKASAPIAQAQVCFEAVPGKCVMTGADGGFQISDGTPISVLAPLRRPTPPASGEWFDAGGRLLGAPHRLRLDRRGVAWPEYAGLAFLRPTAAEPSSARGFAAPVVAKTAATQVDPPGGALTVTKAGIHSWTYYPAFEKETDAKIVVPVEGDEVLFEGKNMDQWVGKPGDWTIENNALHGKGSVGQIFTKGDYGSFRLFVTSRVVIPEVNNGDDHLGILYWGKRPAAGSYGNNGIQVQPPNGYMWGYGVGGNPSPKRIVPQPGWRYHLWHTSELLVNMQTGEGRYAIFGTEITQWKHTGGTKPGTIGMQIHAATTTVEYKDIWIEKDPKEPTKLISVRK